MEIRVAIQQVSIKKHGGYRQFVENCLRLRWSTGLQIDWSHPQGIVLAQIVRSSWVARCPYCPSQMFVQPGEPFFCPDCALQGNGHKPMAVVWPKERQAIELILLKRDNPMNRNWLTGETVDDLIRENVEHGIAGG